MKQKKWYATLVSVVLSLVVFVGVLAFATQYGSEDDPLVSLSYINTVFKPQVQKEIDLSIDKKLESHLKSVDNTINVHEDKLDKKMAEFVSSNSASVTTSNAINNIADSLAQRVGNNGQSNPAFALVKITNGQTIVLSLGSEVLLRIGNAVCVSSGTPGLIDTTTASNLANAQSLSKNHLYLCTVEGRGVKAKSDVTVLVRGAYSIK